MSTNEKVFSNLMVRSQNGDEEAYKELLTKLSMFLDNYLRKKIQQEEFVDEVIQESLIAIHKSRHTYDPNRSFMSWFLAIANYKINDVFRSKEFSLPKIEISFDIIDEKDGPLDTLIQADLNEALFQHIESLDERSRRIIYMLKIEGLKISEVAIRLSISESNVKVIAHRAIHELKNKFKGYLNESK